jgi:hypothetical protein
MIKRITDGMKIAVAARAANPFTEGTKQHRRAAAVLGCKGKTVADAKKKGADQWTVREMARRKLISTT